MRNEGTVGVGKTKKGRMDSGGSSSSSSVTQGNQKVCEGKKETWENKLLERGSEERAEEGKTAGGKKK